MALIDLHGRLLRLEWRTRAAFEQLAEEFTRETGLSLAVRSGRRSCAEQNAIYAQGRTAPGDIITYAPGCRSWHVSGRAVDADPVTASGARTGREADYARAGAIWKRLGGVWGGDFAGFWDGGHFEWHPGLSVNDDCPSGSNCDTVTAAIVTQTPLYAKVATPFWGMILGGVTYAVWRKWKGSRR